MLKVGRKRKRKEKKKEKKHTNSIARIRMPETSPRSQGKKYKICSISEYYVTINHATHRLKKKHSSLFFKCK